MNCLLQTCSVAVIGRHTQRAQPPQRLVQPQPAHRQIQLEQRHAAADIVPSQLRIDPVCQNGTTDRPEFTGMQIRERRDFAHAGPTRDVLKLLFGPTINPGRRCIEFRDDAVADHSGRATIQDRIAHKTVPKNVCRNASQTPAIGIKPDLISA